MKKIKLLLFTVITLSLSGVIKSQEATIDPNYNFKILTNKLDKSDKDIENPKKSASSATWIKRGEMFFDIYKNDQDLLNIGMDPNQLVIFYKEPKEKTTEERNGKVYEVYKYERVDVYLDNGKVSDWNVHTMAAEDPLFKAYESYKKAIEVDDKGKVAEKINPNLDKLVEKLEFEAGINFRRQEYKKSKSFFEYLLKTNKLRADAFATIDTSNIYNTGLAATYGGMYDEAVKFLEMAKSYDYGDAGLYALLKNAYLELGDTTKILPLLKEGFLKFPESNDLVVELINYYLNRGISDQALEYLKIAKEKDPENATFYFAEGTLYDKIGEKDKTIESYNLAIKYKPDWFDPYYNMGVIYYNKAVEIFDEASKIPPNQQTKYDAEMKRGNDELEEALPYMEKALEISEKSYNEDPRNAENIKTYKGTLDTLKTIYFRLRNRKDDYQQKLDEVTAKLEKFN